MPPALPDSLVRLLSLLRPAFTAPCFDTFCWLVHGFVGRVGERTVTGLWQAARLAGVFHHSRAHDFFARRCWSADRLGFALCEFVVGRFVGEREAIQIAIDDTLFARVGRKVFAASWQFDAAAPQRKHGPLRFGNLFVCLGIIVRLQGRVVCLPLLFRLWRPGHGSVATSRVELAHELIGAFAERFADRRIELCADAYYANRSLRGLPANVCAYVRLRANASLWAHAPKPDRPRRGRPRTCGERIGQVKQIAQRPSTRWQHARVRTDAGEQRLQTTTLDCLWFPVLGAIPVRVVIVRQPSRHDQAVLAVLCTDPTAAAAQILSRYTDRWTIELAFAEAKGQFGVGEARNRVPKAVHRTVPFGFLCRAIVILWYALHGNPNADVERHRKTAPWYRHKRAPSFADQLHALRRELIRSEFRRTYPPNQPHQQIRTAPATKTPDAA